VSLLEKVLQGYRSPVGSASPEGRYRAPVGLEHIAAAAAAE